MNITQAFVIFVTVFILAMDVYLVWNKQRSESQEIKDWALRWSFVPMFAGILMGHWFFPGYHVVGDLKVVIPVLCVNVGYDAVCHKYILGRPWWRFPAWYVLLGFPIGALFWGQGL